MAEIPACTNFSIPSTNGKKASDAATILLSSDFWNCFIFSIAILQLSSLLDCPDPIPRVVWLFAITIALDLTNRHILKAKIKFLYIVADGFFLETILKFFLENEPISGDCIKIELKLEIKLSIF